MPSGTHKIELYIPINTIWELVSDMDKWAPLVPGYIEHEILNERQSTWTFKGEVGIVQKKVSMQLNITNWQKPTKVTFDLKGLNENFSGSGYFEAEALSNTKTKMTSNLDIKAAGMLGPMINPFLKSFVPKTTTELTDAIANKLMKVEAFAK
ncbi:SRPBCC family protein [Aquibacillus halophilus]|uniref:SRPBCC family protein n=1 Tax=Aquibacillus halophilus TaxID=930132 RepID=A0A6A8DH53_9BACI|nr:SRPBCC family protein [Aquibacillus halophilus]MRH45028.1 SRPBCC family protein [Aquibacillus halophilus]